MWREFWLFFELTKKVSNLVVDLNSLGMHQFTRWNCPILWKVFSRRPPRLPYVFRYLLISSLSTTNNIEHNTKKWWRLYSYSQYWTSLSLRLSQHPGLPSLFQEQTTWVYSSTDDVIMTCTGGRRDERRFIQREFGHHLSLACRPKPAFCPHNTRWFTFAIDEYHSRYRKLVLGQPRSWRRRFRRYLVERWVMTSYDVIECMLMNIRTER